MSTPTVNKAFEDMYRAHHAYQVATATFMREAILQSTDIWFKVMRGWFPSTASRAIQSVTESLYGGHSVITAHFGRTAR